MLDLNLANLKRYLMSHNQATLTDLANYFRNEPDVVESMLQHWILKQKVECIQVKTCTKGCCQGGCDLNIYRWIGTTNSTGKIIPIVPACH